MNAEQQRLAAADAGTETWRRWGPYLAERAWGTVREDYSADGDAWAYLPHDAARSTAYRWNEDGLAGISDEDQNLCLAFAFWNGVDPILKERAFGLSGPEGNHGEDVKEKYWYVDNTPTHSFMRWRYHYPQREFPYSDLVEENQRRGRDQPEYELDDTGVFADNRYFDITVDFAKASPDDICIRLTAVNRGPEAATLHVLPHLWCRNTWQWARTEQQPPVLRASGTTLDVDHPRIGRWVLTSDGTPTALACDNETNLARRYGDAADSPACPKDGINDHVLHGAGTVASNGTGTRGALWHRLDIAPGATAEVRLRLTTAPADVADGWAGVFTEREREADEFWNELTGALDENRKSIVRQALSGLLWSKQFYHYDVDRWLTGDPREPAPPASRLHARNAGWRHLDNHDVIVMPDTWEYPWYASWDLAFHCVALAHVDPEFAKHQLVLLGREWYMHPNGQLPAYEWNFSDVNPPVEAWAALQVFTIDGERDVEFLERVFHKLLLNFTWWVNRVDSQGNNAFEGGFLGLDNIGPFDRSSLPVAGVLEQSDGTAWMACYCLDMLETALTLARHDATYSDVAVKFFEHFAYISTALVDQGLWNEDDGFFYDVLHCPSGQDIPLRYRSVVGLLPICAVLRLDHDVLEALPDFAARVTWFLEHRPQYARALAFGDGHPDGDLLLSVVDHEQLQRLLTRLFDTGEFLSPHGIRALSAAHRDAPFVVDVEGVTASVDYEPGESRTALFGGNSNWRGPVWMPLNFLLVRALRRFDDYLGDGITVSLPSGGASLAGAADDVANRLIALFLPDASGAIPAAGGDSWPDGLLWFHEYFHGDTGKGLGACHQTGWTALVADLVLHNR